MSGGVRHTNVEPVLPGFFPDPSICAADGTYYLVSSTFEYLPGVPIHSSTDLVHWEPVGHVHHTREQLDLRGAPSGAGTFAPTIRFHDGELWAVTTDIGTVGEGQLLSRATDPRGPWSIPVRVPGTAGIDPDLFWDEDGTCHLTWSGFLDGAHGILSRPIDPRTGEVLGEIRRMWQGTGLAHPEGPHLYRVGGYYYCLLAEGGTERGHCVTIARATSLDGPWESAPGNPVLTHRSTAHPVQNTGHADLVELADGSWAMVHLGVRPRGRTPQFHVNGRETFVVGIDWVDGWPVADEGRFAVPRVDTAFVDSFSGELDLRWVSPGGAHWDLVSAAAGGVGGVVVAPAIVGASGDGVPADREGGGEGGGDGVVRPALCVRARDAGWRASARFAGTDAVLGTYLDTDHWVELRVAGGRAVAEVGVAGLRHVLADVAVDDGAAGDGSPVDGEAGGGEARDGELELWCAAIPFSDSPYAQGGPDQVVLGLRTGDGVDVEIARIDGRLLSTEVAGGFTGSSDSRV